MYGVLGLAPTEFADAIHADYDADVSILYATYTFAVTTYTKALMPMRQSWIGMKITTMPSRVPELAQKVTTEDHMMNARTAF